MDVKDSDSPVRNTFHFDRFEIQVHQETLLCDGERIKIQALPFRLLLALVENAGSVISSEELGKLLGGSSYQVELGSLRVAATKLREALGDDASAPRFIKTVSGQGYKFIAAVTRVPEATDGTSDTVISQMQEDVGPQSNILALSRRLSMWLVFGVTASALTFFLLYKYSHRTLVDRTDSIVLGGFVNKTGEHDMDETLSSAFRVKMQESPYFNLASDRKFRHLVHDPEVATLDESLAACRSLQGKILLRGELSIHKLEHDLTVRAWACDNGRQLTSRTVEARSRPEILPALDRAIEQMRGRLGEPDDSLQKFNVPLNQATTSSLVALRAFTQAEDKRAQGLEPESIADYKLAADLDPQFALAFARLGAVAFNAGEYALSRQNFQKAFDLRGRTTDRERLYITANYYGFATGEIERAIEAYELWRKIYPQDIVPANNLAIEYVLVGQPEKATQLAQTAMLLEPTSPLTRATAAMVNLKMGDYAALNALCAANTDQANNSIVLQVRCFEGAFAQHDEAAMTRHLDWGKGNSQQTQLFQEAATAALSKGKLNEAWGLFAKARQSALDNDLAEFASGTTLNEAGFAADLGYAKQAREEVAEAQKLAPGSALTLATAALALARAGDIAQAETFAERASAKSPLDTIVNSAVLAAERSAIHLDRHESQEAVQALEESRPYDFNDFMYLSSAYYRGLAYLQTKQPIQAAAEFQRLLGHRVFAPDSPYLTLSQLELGRILQLAGNEDEARNNFEALDKEWNEADPDFPPLKRLRVYERQLPTDRR